MEVFGVWCCVKYLESHDSRGQSRKMLSSKPVFDVEILSQKSKAKQTKTKQKEQQKEKQPTKPNKLAEIPTMLKINI